MVTLDGSYGEGGGQVLRTGLSLAALTSRELELRNIRARRSKPGLQPQHLASVRAVAALCAAKLEGDAVGSQRLLFAPQAAVQPGEWRFDISTAGATSLVFQSVFVPLARAADGSRVATTGGTHVPHAPVVDYLESVYLPALARAGLHGQVSFDTAGFYPRGGGELVARIPGKRDPACAVQMTERGGLLSLRAYIVSAGLPAHVGERGAATVERYLKGVGRKAQIDLRQKDRQGPGAAVVVAAACEGGFAGFTALGERGKPMERVAEEACTDFMRWWKSGAACDEHLADQLVLPLALVDAESRWTIPVVTEHLRTVLWVARQFLPIEYHIDERPGAPALVTLRGAPPGTEP